MANYIFDLDGTLWNAVTPSVKGWNSALDEIGLTEFHIKEHQLISLVGHPRPYILKKLFPFLKDEKYQEMYNLSAQYSFDSIKNIGGIFYPNMKNVLEELSKKHQLYIVSNCQEEYLELFFKQSKTKSLFRDWECWGRSGQNKATNIKYVMKKNGIKDAFYVGDTDGDYLQLIFSKTFFLEDFKH